MRRGFAVGRKFSKQWEGWERDKLENDIISTDLQYKGTKYD